MNKILNMLPLWFSARTKTSLITTIMLGTFSILAAQDNWMLHSIVPTSNCLRCIISTSPARQGGIRLVCGDSGTIISSADNNTWTVLQSGTTSDLLGILPNVAVGKNGTVVSTAVGASWHSQISRTKWNFGGLARRNLYVAVGDSGLILTSPDDSTWTTQISGTIKCLRAISCNMSPYANPSPSLIVVGDSGTILTSPDGIIWSSQVSGTKRNLNSVGFGYLSTVPTLVVVGDSGTILTSLNGVIWNGQTSGTTNTLRSIFTATDALNFEACLYVAVGDKGTILSSRTRIGSSPGIAWTSQVSGTTKNLYGVTSTDFDSLMVVGDSGTILTSYYKPLTTKIEQGKITERWQWVSISNRFVNYSLAEPSQISMTLYDIKGRLVKTLINQIQQPRSYSVAMPQNVSPGVYSVAFRAGNQRINKIVFASGK